MDIRNSIAPEPVETSFVCTLSLYKYRQIVIEITFLNGAVLARDFTNNFKLKMFSNQSRVKTLMLVIFLVINNKSAKGSLTLFVAK